MAPPCPDCRHPAELPRPGTASGPVLGRLLIVLGFALLGAGPAGILAESARTGGDGIRSAATPASHAGLTLHELSGAQTGVGVEALRAGGRVREGAPRSPRLRIERPDASPSFAGALTPAARVDAVVGALPAGFLPDRTLAPPATA